MNYYYKLLLNTNHSFVFFSYSSQSYTTSYARKAFIIGSNLGGFLEGTVTIALKNNTKPSSFFYFTMQFIRGRCNNLFTFTSTDRVVNRCRVRVKQTTRTCNLFWEISLLRIIYLSLSFSFSLLVIIAEQTIFFSPFFLSPTNPLFLLWR